MKIQARHFGGEGSESIVGIPSVAAIRAVVPEPGFEDRIVDEDRNPAIGWCGGDDRIGPESKDGLFVELLTLTMLISILQRREKRGVRERRIAIADHNKSVLNPADSSFKDKIGPENVEGGAGRDELHIARGQERAISVDGDDLPSGTGAVIARANTHGDLGVLERAGATPGLRDQTLHLRGKCFLLRRSRLRGGGDQGEAGYRCQTAEFRRRDTRRKRSKRRAHDLVGGGFGSEVGPPEHREG